MTNLTQNEQNVVDALRAAHGEDEMDGMKLVYLDNALDLSNRSVVATLGSLEKKGYYMTEDGYAWGWVKT
jgi:hypothetical protein